MALAFGLAGFSKLAMPIEELAKNMAWVSAVPLLARVIGAAELAGALGRASEGRQTWAQSTLEMPGFDCAGDFRHRLELRKEHFEPHLLRADWRLPARGGQLEEEELRPQLLEQREAAVRLRLRPPPEGLQLFPERSREQKEARRPVATRDRVATRASAKGSSRAGEPETCSARIRRSARTLAPDATAASRTATRRAKGIRAERPTLAPRGRSAGR